MYIVEILQKRPNSEIPWPARNQKISEILNKEKEEGRLLFERVSIHEDETISIYTAVWDSEDSHLNYISLPEIKNHFEDRKKYNEENHIIMHRITGYNY